MAEVAPNTSQGLSPYISGYGTDILGRASALTNLPYTPYGGNRLAEFSPLQRQAFEGIGSLAGYKPVDYSGASFTDPGKMQQFMSPYQQGVVDIAKEQARRDADITAQTNAARAVQQGAFGGSRHGLVEAEHQRNLERNLSDIQTKGLQAAYESAQKQFNTEAQQEQQRQYLRDLQGRYGLDAQMRAGRMQQEQEQKGLDIDYGTFKEERDYPFEMLRFASGIMGGFPKTSTTSDTPTDWGSTLGGIAGLLGNNPNAVKNLFSNLGSNFSSLFGGGGSSAAAESAMSGINEYDWL